MSGRLLALIFVSLATAFVANHAAAQGIPPHTADQDADFRISLSELLRVIQFFNVGGFHCAQEEENSEDGFASGIDVSQQECARHNSDYATEDWSVALDELLRLIQFYNSGGYYAECDTEDDYAPGAGDGVPCFFVGDFTDPQDATGTVLLPVGRGEALDSLVVSTATDDWPVDAQGDFAATVISDSSSLVIVLDGSGDPLLTGFIEPDAIAAETILDAASTAIALLYFALGGFLLPQENRPQVLAEIAASPEATTLAAAIEADLAAGGFPLLQDTGDAADAILAARAAFVARLNAATEGEGGGEGGGSRKRQTKGDTTLTNILVQPGGDVLQSGLQVLQADDGGVLVQNNFRRRSYYYAYQTGYETLDGTTVELNPPVLVGEPEKITTTAALGEFTGIIEVFREGAPWAPFQVGPFGLPKFSGASSVVRTDYELILVGANLNPSSLPSDYPDARYAGELAGWQSDYAFLQAETFFVDFVISIVMLASTGASSALQARKVSGAIEELQGTFDPEFARLGLALPLDTPAEYKAAAKEALLLMRDNDIVRASTLNTLKGLWATSTSNRANLERLQSTLRNGTRMSAIVLAIETTITALDLGAVIKDLLNSNSVDRWDAIVTDRVVRINPSSPTIEEEVETTATLRAFVNGLPDGDFCYRWTLEPGSSGEIFTALEDGPEFITTEDEITYFISPVDWFEGAVAQVTVEVFVRDAESWDCILSESIGTRTVTVEGIPKLEEPCDEDDLDVEPFMRPSTDFMSISGPTLIRNGVETVEFTVTLNWSAITQYTVNPIDLSLSRFYVSGAGFATNDENQTSILVNGAPLVDSPTSSISRGGVGTVSSEARLQARTGLIVGSGLIQFLHPDNGGTATKVITVPMDPSFSNDGCVRPGGGSIFAYGATLNSVPNFSNLPDFDETNRQVFSSYRVDLGF